MKLTAKIEQLETLSRTRALSDKESRQLEDCLRRAGLIAKSSGNECVRGHEMVGDNIVIDRGREVCRECRREDKRASNARAKARTKQAELDKTTIADRSNGWTVEHLRQLKVAYEMGWTDAMIGSHLGRSPQAVKTTRARYGICAVATRPAQHNTPTPEMERERKRGERLLDLAFGGKPKRDDRPCNPTRFIVPDSAYRGIPSNAGMAVA